jgi:hypothetical protein
MNPPRNAVSGMKRITAARIAVKDWPTLAKPPFTPPNNLPKKFNIEVKIPPTPADVPPPLLNHPNRSPANITISSIADIQAPAAAAFRVEPLSSTIM